MVYNEVLSMEENVVCKYNVDKSECDGVEYLRLKSSDNEYFLKFIESEGVVGVGLKCYLDDDSVLLVKMMGSSYCIYSLYKDGKYYRSDRYLIKYSQLVSDIVTLYNKGKLFVI